MSLSRHRQDVQTHYGRDDFESPQRLAGVLGRERAKDSTLDYGHVRERLADERGHRGSPKPAAERSVEPDARRRNPFAGLNLGRAADQAPGLSRDSLKKLGLGHAAASVAASAAPLDRAVQGYARALEDIRSMERQGLKPLGWQQSAIAQARDALDGVRANGHDDLSTAVAGDPTLVAEAGCCNTPLTACWSTGSHSRFPYY